MEVIEITCSQYCVVADASHCLSCDDALICYYGNSVYVEFDREAKSLDEAIESAIPDFETAGIGAVVESVGSTLVGLSDIAQLSGLTRQAITLLKDGLRGKGDFPCPVQRISGQSPLWDWAEVAKWLNDCGRLDSKDEKAREELVRNARTLSTWNLALRMKEMGETHGVERVTRSLSLLHTHRNIY
ncbi:helix-turn-helix transcriptional regulator [Escherichia coli]|uniref:helix-turn-helix transcriptional regulator n=1 Tax=Escherichia coli TaxID=562 RepID=UPI003986890C